MKKIAVTIGLLFTCFGGAAFATENECDKRNGQYTCQVGDTNYTIKAESAAEALAAAVAYADQKQSQSSKNENKNDNDNTNKNDNDNSNSSSNTNKNSYRSEDDSVKLDTPAGGGCTWGVNVAVPGEGGFGVCGTTRNSTAIFAAQVADAIGNPCAPENKLAAQLLLQAPIAKGMKLTCN